MLWKREGRKRLLRSRRFHLLTEFGQIQITIRMKVRSITDVTYFIPQSVGNKNKNASRRKCYLAEASEFI
jgi:hypothetical protein